MKHIKVYESAMPKFFKSMRSQKMEIYTETRNQGDYMILTHHIPDSFIDQDNEDNGVYLKVKYIKNSGKNEILESGTYIINNGSITYFY